VPPALNPPLRFLRMVVVEPASMMLAQAFVGLQQGMRLSCMGFSRPRCLARSARAKEASLQRLYGLQVSDPLLRQAAGLCPLNDEPQIVRVWQEVARPVGDVGDRLTLAALRVLDD